MDPNDDHIRRLEEEVRSLRREMDEMKALIRSLLQELLQSAQEDEDDFFEFN